MSALPSSSSSFHQRKFKYGIFLSFYGTDTRHGFTDHLRSALTDRRIQTFRDDRSLEKGEDFPQELLRAIGESWGSIIVISKGYSSSRWCLDELVEIMKQREEREHRVYPIFYHVEPSHFRKQENSVKVAFDEHENRYNRDTQAWRVALEKVTAISGWTLKTDQYESVFIEDIVNDIYKKINTEIFDEKEVEMMKRNFRKIQALLVDGENKQYMKDEEAPKVLLDELKRIAYDMDDVLDEWNTAILKSNIEKDQPQTPSISSSSVSGVQHSIGGRDANFSGLPDLNLPAPESNISSTFFHSSGAALCHDIVPRIKKLNEECQPFIERIKDSIPFSLRVNDNCTDSRLKRSEELPLVDESVVYGRDHDKDALIHFLLSDGNSEGGTYNGIPLLAIVGMGGIGKTTLARLAYNNEKVEKHFHQRLWVCVSHPFDEAGIAKTILENLTGTSSNFNALQTMWQKIHHNIKGKRFLLVLDDVWTENRKQLESLKLYLSVGSQESRILVTTRNERVAHILGCTKQFSLRGLSNEAGWSIFHKIAFSGSYQDRENLESIGKKCVEKCDGLPLAIKTLASLLLFNRTREQWQRILNSHLWELADVEGLFSPLLLSYYDLPSPLRQCFSYCAIFPKDHVIKKDLLIKYWMAQGFLGERSDMEIVGEEYFDNLAARSFFQEFEKDEDDGGRIIGCKMHDIVHDFALFLRKTECCVVLASSKERGAYRYHENVRHFTLISDYCNGGIPDLIYNVKRLRSFLLLVCNSLYRDGYRLESWPESFNQLTCLRKLHLSQDSIRVLPPEIGTLIHLRYLGIEQNSNLFELPEALCDLCNLQTLNIRGCQNLRKLPDGMEKLINLRHLQNAKTYNLTMPRGMRRLTCLRTLEWSNLWLNLETKGGNESETSFRLADLGNLINLRGKLMITLLGNVGEAEVSEAWEAPLSTKAGLRELSLYFDGVDDEKEPQRRIKDEASFLRALKPPQDLRKLEIMHCEGPKFPFPNWMTSLTSLKSVKFWGCDNWESLPPMGKLPCLESLAIRGQYGLGMKKVKKVGEEFLGLETSTSSYSSVNHNNIIAFPNLKKLKFHCMEGWEEWEYDEKVLRSKGGDDSSSSNITTITVMPKLQHLKIHHCKVLKTLPRHLLQSRTLQQLEIRFCPILERCFNRETREDWSSISHIPNAKIG